MGKDEVRKRFSERYEEYYKVRLFEELGFERKRCKNCGKYFWTLDPDRETCGDQPCEPYTFIGSPPSPLRPSYLDTWGLIAEFFEKKGHKVIPRYPVVSRWRPDLYFTVASIIDFQRVEGGKIVFELPENPLLVPQVCLRFNDLDKVGITGRHYSSFCMIGQHSIPDGKGYWKDECIELDFELLTKVFGIRPEEVTFVEDAWLGYGAFGYSLEYFVRGLELGNAVFTEFEGTPERFKRMDKGVVDMGAGLERFPWLLNGTPTSYDVVFEPVLERLEKRIGKLDRSGLKEFVILAGIEGDRTPNLDELLGRLGVGKEEAEEIRRLVSAYILLDHSRTLAYGIADGMLPSNVGGGYNLRVVLRRLLSMLDGLGWDVSLIDLIEWHSKHLKPLYPELEEHLEDVRVVLEVEEQRYRKSLKRIEGIVSRLEKGLSEADVIRLYESEGISPELLKERGLIEEVPQDLYSKLTKGHLGKAKAEAEVRPELESLPPTELLFYKDRDLMEFDAKVLKVIGDEVVLDRTAFYPRAGGQEPDKGTIGGLEVLDVVKYGDVVVHKVAGALKEGEVVRCRVDEKRRLRITRHHTATHIINSSARRVLGPWVWQHTAFKDEDKAYLEITHFKHLRREELLEIERLANEVVRRNLPVVVRWLERGEAERRYGFGIYQGGVAPVKLLRIVEIDGFDAQACGGTHCRSTGEVGLIKLLGSERVQDGVERINFLAGDRALEYVEREEASLAEVASMLSTQRDRVVEGLKNLIEKQEGLKREYRALLRRSLDALVREVVDRAERIGGIRLYMVKDSELGEGFYISLGERAIEAEPSLVLVAFVLKGGRARVVAFSGGLARDLGIKAGELARLASRALGGGGGGDDRFGQGGGDPSRLGEAMEAVRRYVSGARF